MRRALGKGLSQLVAEQFEGGAQEVPIEEISANVRQPRTQFREETLQELAASIREYGILQPLIVRPVGEGRFELIAGERRLRAAKLAGLTTVPVIQRAAGNQTSLELALIENVQREDIGPLECAVAYRRLMDEFGLTQEQVAERVGKSRAAVANAVRLLRLPPRVLDGLQAGEITEGHARALLQFESDPERLAAYDAVIRQNLNVRDVERLAQRPAVRPKAERPVGTRPTPDADPNDRALEEAASIYLAAPVKIERGPIGGRMSVEFFSDDDLERILEVLGIRL